MNKITKEQYLEAAEGVFKHGLLYTAERYNGKKCLIGHLMDATKLEFTLKDKEAYLSPWSKLTLMSGFWDGVAEDGSESCLWEFNDGVGHFSNLGPATPDEVSNFFCFMAAACDDL